METEAQILWPVSQFVRKTLAHRLQSTGHLQRTGDGWGLSLIYACPRLTWVTETRPYVPFKISKESGCRALTDNFFLQLKSKMFLWNKISLYFNGCFFFFSFLKKKEEEEESTTALNKNAHRMRKSSGLAVQNTEEVMTAWGHFGLRCCRRGNEQLGIS